MLSDSRSVDGRSRSVGQASSRHASILGGPKPFGSRTKASMEPYETTRMD